jgi:hypothetical protein
MSTDLTTSKTQLPAKPETRNWAEQMEDEIPPRYLVGRMLKFNRGEYLVGKNEGKLPQGTKLVALMDDYLEGWIRWVDNRPDRHEMGLRSKGYKPLEREELGDMDNAHWETDPRSNRLKDPWQKTAYLVLRPVGKPDAGEEELYTFTTSSAGGLKACYKLGITYGKEGLRLRPGMYPIVQLSEEEYPHPDKSIGRVKNPVFKVVGWEPKGTKENENVEPSSESPSDEEIPF